MEISCEVFVNRNQMFLPLQCQNDEAAEAAFKDKDCEI